MKTFENLLVWVKNFFFPRNCVLCGCSFVNLTEMRYGLCSKCHISLGDASKSAACSLCGKPLISEKDMCLSCRNNDAQRHYERMRVVFPYIGKYRKLLTAYKFGKNLALSRIFTERILEVIEANPVLKDAVIVPVPPRPGKKKIAGWDQVDYLVRELKKIKRKEIKVSKCLKRRKSRVQKELGRNERMENLKGRICLNGNAVPKKALIIDDVITTGSTIEVCSSVLKDGGAKEVYGLCLFYD